MTNENYFRYKELKRQFVFNYKGFDLDRILALYIWTWANTNEYHFWLLKFFFKSIDYTFLENIQSEYVFYTDETRKDHNTTFCQVAERITDKYEVINKSKGLKYPLHLSIFNIITSLTFSISHVKNLCIIKRILVAGYICMYLNTIDNLLQLNIRDVKKFVTYSAIHEKQNLLIQFFRLKGAHVFGLSHGAQFVYCKNIPIDCLNYENLDVDCLVWGQMTKDEYIKYGIEENRLFVAGYPKKYKPSSLISAKPLKRCIVLLCRETFDNSNVRLLNTISKFVGNYEFSLKLHPSCDFAKYSTMSKKMGVKIIPKDVMITECMNNQKFDFAIAVNTTTYYEIMMAGIPCLRFKDGDAFDLMPGEPNDVFSSTGDFERCIAWLNDNLINGNYDKTRNKLLERAMGIGLDNYHKILVE